MKRSEHLQQVYDGALESGRLHHELVGLKRQIAAARDAETAAAAAAARDTAIRSYELLSAHGASTERLEPFVQRAERNARVARTLGPRRTAALVADGRGRMREVPVERRACAKRVSARCRGTVEFVGDARQSEPCTVCGGSQWRS